LQKRNGTELKGLFEVPFFDDGKCETIAEISALQCFSISCISAVVRGKKKIVNNNLK
jgi:hypothetical protein